MSGESGGSKVRYLITFEELKRNCWFYQGNGKICICVKTGNADYKCSESKCPIIKELEVKP
jgi:hypothetical protein